MEQVRPKSDLVGSRFPDFSEMSKLANIALAALGAGIGYLVGKSLQDRGFSCGYFESFPVLKIAGAVAGCAILGIGGYYFLGSGKTIKSETKEDSKLEDHGISEDVWFRQALPKWLCSAIVASEVPYVFKSYSESEHVFDVCAGLSESLIFFDYSDHYGMHLKLMLTDPSGESKEVPVIVYNSKGDDASLWRCSHRDSNTVFENVQDRTTWNPKDEAFAKEQLEPAESSKGVFSLDQMLYTCLAGKEYTFKSDSGDEEAQQWSLSLRKPLSLL